MVFACPHACGVIDNPEATRPSALELTRDDFPVQQEQIVGRATLREVRAEEMANSMHAKESTRKIPAGEYSWSWIRARFTSRVVHVSLIDLVAYSIIFVISFSSVGMAVFAIVLYFEGPKLFTLCALPQLPQSYGHSRAGTSSSSVPLSNVRVRSSERGVHDTTKARKRKTFFNAPANSQQHSSPPDAEGLARSKTSTQPIPDFDSWSQRYAADPELSHWYNNGNGWPDATPAWVVKEGILFLQHGDSAKICIPRWS